MRLLSIVGARPQFVKLAPIGQALDTTSHEHLVLHTGQHYDPSMSGDVLASLHIPEADINLNIGSKSHGAQTGHMLAAVEEVLMDLRPDGVIVYGDTNSTVAGTLAASKLLIPVAHVEAGLRSFDRAMPEEQNRIVADHLSNMLYAPTATAASHLKREGLAERTRLVGDVMTDVCLQVARTVTRPPVLPDGVNAENFVLATIHRPSNTDDPARLDAVLDYLGNVPTDVVVSAHPRLIAKIVEHGIDDTRPGVHFCTPFNYPDLVAALLHTRAVVTDSGGLQKEAYLLGRPCTTLRAETEWVETLERDYNRLDQSLSFPEHVLRDPLPADRADHFGDGKAASRIVDSIASELR